MHLYTIQKGQLHQQGLTDNFKYIIMLSKPQYDAFVESCSASSVLFFFLEVTPVLCCVNSVVQTFFCMIAIHPDIHMYLYMSQETAL